MKRLKGLCLDAPWPENWRLMMPALDLPVVCGGEQHIVRWDRGEVSVLHHTTGERVVAALGGTESPCHGIARAWRTGTPEPFGDDARVEMTPIHNITVGMVDEFFARCDKSTFIEHLAEQVLTDWLAAVGIVSDGGSVGLSVEVINRAKWPHGEPALGFGCGAVGIAGSFGPDMTTRMVVHVTDDWYDQVREFGAVINGRLLLGHNGRGLVLADVRADDEDPHLRWVLGKAYDSIESVKMDAPFTPPSAPPVPPAPSSPRLGFGIEHHYAPSAAKDEALAAPDVWLTGERDARGWCADHSVRQASLGVGLGGTVPFEMLRRWFPPIDLYVGSMEGSDMEGSDAAKRVYSRMAFGDLMAFCAEQGANFADCCVVVGVTEEVSGSGRTSAVLE